MASVVDGRCSVAGNIK